MTNNFVPKQSTVITVNAQGHTKANDGEDIKELDCNFSISVLIHTVAVQLNHLIIKHLH